MKFSRLFTKLDGGAFGYALSMDGSTCLQLGTHGSLTSVSPVASCVPASYIHVAARRDQTGAAFLRACCRSMLQGSVRQLSCCGRVRFDGRVVSSSTVVCMRDYPSGIKTTWLARPEMTDSPV